MTKTNPLTRKAGPLPVWAWAALALVAVYLYLHRAPAAAGGTQLPFTPPAASGSGSQLPVSGQGSPADNGNADLLDALGNNLASSDALLAALQSSPYGSPGGGGGGYYGGGSEGTTTGDTSATSAATVTASPDPGTTSTTVTPDPPASGDYYVIPATETQPQQYFQPTGWFQNEQGYGLVHQADTTPDAIDRYLASHGAATLYTTDTAPVTQPTPILVQPAPVDTGGVIVDPTPRPVVGKNVAV